MMQSSSSGANSRVSDLQHDVTFQLGVEEAAAPRRRSATAAARLASLA